MWTLPCCLDNGIVVLDITFVEHHFNLGWTVVTQLTKCKYGIRVFYVRENFNGFPSFLLSSAARMGIKSKSIPRSYQVLELCCPATLFNQLASMIYAFDELHRPVLHNSKFTYQWAQRQFQAPL